MQHGVPPLLDTSDTSIKNKQKFKKKTESWTTSGEKQGEIKCSLLSENFTVVSSFITNLQFICQCVRKRLNVLSGGFAPVAPCYSL